MGLLVHMILARHRINMMSENTGWEIVVYVVAVRKPREGVRQPGVENTTANMAGRDQPTRIPPRSKLESPKTMGRAQLYNPQHTDMAQP